MLARLFLFTLFFPAMLVAQEFSEAGRMELERYLADAQEKHGIPGMVALVTNQDRVIYQGAFGNRHVAQASPMTMEALFNLASMTKPVTSLAVMMLVEQGSIELDEPVETYLPYLADREVFTRVDFESGEYSARSATNKITVRHLLTHTSGLGYSFDSPELARLLGIDFNASATSLPLLHEPGAAWTYGESTRVLGHLVETVSGLGLFDFLKANILAPLAMANTFYAVPSAKKRRVVTIHNRVDGQFVELPPPAGEIVSPVLGDGGLYGSAHDYASFMRLFLNDGVSDFGDRIIDAQLITAMGEDHTGRVRVRQMPTTNPALSQPFPLGAGEDGFGLGFQITARQDENRRAPGSMSWAGIYNTEFWIDPENQIGVVLLMQYLPFYDAEAIDVLRGFEQRIYQYLQD